MLKVDRCLMALVVSLFLASGVFAEEEPAKSDTAGETDQGITKHGFVHNIAPDRRVEKVGGIYEPESLDKYIQRHMENLSKQVSDLDAKISRVETQLKEIAQLLKGPGKSAEGAPS